jgi:cyclopropane fatty-acyl-phospholipid synthase-like methyltransferase
MVRGALTSIVLVITLASAPDVALATKDVIFVATPHEVVERMLDLAEVSNADIVVDLGSGDGRIVRAAARRGAKAIGIEYDRNLVVQSERLAKQEGVSDRATFLQGDLFEADFSYASVVMLYLLPALNAKLAPKLQRLSPGARIVSHQFAMTPNWTPEKTEKIDGRSLYLWRLTGGDCPDFVHLNRASETLRFDLATYVRSSGGKQQAMSEIEKRLANRNETASYEANGFKRLLTVLHACR